MTRIMNRKEIDSLHESFLKDEYTKEIFAWDLIGIAQLESYNWKKTGKPFLIPFNKFPTDALEFLDYLERLCKKNGIDFARNERHEFVIEHTAFMFYHIEGFNAFLYKNVRKPVSEEIYWFSDVKDNVLIYKVSEIYHKDNLKVRGFDLLVWV